MHLTESKTDELMANLADCGHRVSTLGSQLKKMSVVVERQADRIEDLESQLAEAERAIAELRAEYAKRDARCEHFCMGYPAIDVRHWVAKEALERAEAERDEAKREKSMAMRLMRAREDRLTAIRDMVQQQKGDDLVRAEVAYFLDCPQSDIESRTTESDIVAALKQAMGAD